jgi:RNA polymerase sigma-70 factor (family 1)
MVRKMNEAEIIHGLKNGDQRAFNALFEIFFARLQHFARSLTHETQEAEDIVIRIFNSFWNRREAFNDLINIQAFFFIAVRNSCFNYLRSRERIQQHQREYKDQLPAPGDYKTAERKLIEAEVLSLLMKKIDVLPKKCREIFMLTYFENLTSGEIAQRLNISTSTVTTQRARALKILRTVFTEEEFLVVLFWLGCLSG